MEIMRDKQGHWAHFRAIWIPLVFAFLYTACSAGPIGIYQDNPIPTEKRIDKIVIYKSDHRMEAWFGAKLMKIYSIAIGSGNEGPKRQQGDKKTPEGRYRITKRFVSEKFHRFLHISYPNENDRKQFLKGKQKGSIAQNTNIGGSIGIHGEKSKYGWLPHKWVD